MTADSFSKGTFIPYRRSDVIEMCLNDGALNEEDKDRFRTFCRILTAYYHYCFHDRLNRLKDYFIPLDPDSPYKKYEFSHDKNDTEKIETFFNDFEHILKKANYHKLSKEEIKKSFKDRSLIQLDFDLDFTYMEDYLLYYRGLHKTNADVQILPLFKKNIEFDVFDRMILVIKYKSKEFFDSKKINVGNLNFIPGRTYLYFYKNIPVNDLEILFPNVKIRMTLKDQLLFWIPAIGAGIGSLSKVLPNLAILIGFIVLLLGLQDIVQNLGLEIDEEDINKSIYPLLVTIFSVVMVLGGYAVKQYLKYKNKFIHFMKNITDTLFFRSISINTGVFQTLIDSAEEEECKEAILAYYHLLANEEGMSKAELDKHIETWFMDKHQTNLNFDVVDAVDKLRLLVGKVYDHSGDETIRVTEPLMFEDKNGKLHVQPLEKAIVILDAIWDDIFHYNLAHAVCQEEKF